MERPEVNSYIYDQLISYRAKAIQWGKGSSLQQVVLGQLDIHFQNKEGGFYFIPYTK